MIDPDPSFAPIAGQPDQIEPGLLRVLAPNASPMTFRGTNTYLLGTRDVAVIDPGPVDSEHLSAILAAVPEGGRISHIIVTHAHLDHSPLAGPLSRRTGAPVLAFGDAFAGRSPVMQQLAASGLMAGGEGVDAEFVPDVTLADGATVETAEWSLEALHTPGHFGNHIALAWQDRLFTGDLVMGWATSLVSPPDGDLTDFMASCERLLERDWSVFYPGHGAPVSEPRARTEWLLAHRRSREAGILSALGAGPLSAKEIAQQLYTDVAPALMPAATRNVLAHLVDLYGKSIVTPVETLSAAGRFRLL